MEPPIADVQTEDKVMPLDLSLKVKFGSEDPDAVVEKEAENDDEVVITMEIPGRPKQPRLISTGPIVIGSDSDSDSDVTILSMMKGDKRIPKLSSEPVELDSDVEECFVYDDKMKSLFADSSCNLSSLASSSSLVDNIVKGNDPFLSDGLSDDIGARLSSDGVVEDKRIKRSIYTGNVDRIPLSLNEFSFLKQNSFKKDDLTTIGLSDISGSGTGLDDDDIQQTGLAKLPMDVDSVEQKLLSAPAIGDLFDSLPKSSDTISTPNDDLTFGISHLLSSSCQPKMVNLSPNPLMSHPPPIADSGIGEPLKTICDDIVYTHKKHRRRLEALRSLNSMTDDHNRASSASVLTTVENKPVDSNVVTKDTSSRLHAFALRVLPQSVGHKVHSPRLSPECSRKRVPTNPKWKVVSSEEGKVVLRRSEIDKSTNCHTTDEQRKRATQSSPKIWKKKSRRFLNDDAMAARKDVAHGTPASPEDAGSSGNDKEAEVEERMNLCYGCKKDIRVSQLSYCMAGHGCCGQCLQQQVKTLLARGKKGTLKCRYIACNSFYLVSQLRNSLPAMVVEILEEKLDREYCDNAAMLMMQTMNAASDEEQEDNERTRSLREAYKDLPKNWEPMLKSEEYRLVDVHKNSEDYQYVTGLFHTTMTRPRAQIVKVQRLQNPILWQFFTVKKTQMERDSSRPVTEKNLFHGTNKDVVDAICRTNFDWRLCGSHGTMYGQGSYFARDAAYSHMYTDQQTVGQSQRSQMPHPSALMFHPPSSHHHQHSSSNAAQIIFQAFPGSSHSVSIAALQSCRFARLPVLPGNPSQITHSPTTPSGPSSSTIAPVPVSPFAGFPYWVGSNNSVQPNAQTNRSQRSEESGAAPTHTHSMFLARVLVGEYTLGKSGYRKPPSIDPANPYGRCYDACVNDINNPTIYVIFNSAQCYPEYVVEYTNRPRE